VSLVRKRGFEPLRYCYRQPLKHSLKVGRCGRPWALLTRPERAHAGMDPVNGSIRTADARHVGSAACRWELARMASESFAWAWLADPRTPFEPGELADIRPRADRPFNTWAAHGRLAFQLRRRDLTPVFHAKRLLPRRSK